MRVAKEMVVLTFLASTCLCATLDCVNGPSGELADWSKINVTQTVSSSSYDRHILAIHPPSSNVSLFDDDCVSAFRLDVKNHNTGDAYHTDVANVLTGRTDVRWAGQCFDMTYVITPRTSDGQKADWLQIENHANISTLLCLRERENRATEAACETAYPVSIPERAKWNSLVLRVRSKPARIETEKTNGLSEEDDNNLFSLVVSTHGLNNLTAVRSCVVNSEVRLISPNHTSVVLVDKDFWSEYPVQFDRLRHDVSYTVEVRALKVGQESYAQLEDDNHWLKMRSFDVMVEGANSARLDKNDGGADDDGGSVYYSIPYLFYVALFVLGLFICARLIKLCVKMFK